MFFRNAEAIPPLAERDSDLLISGAPPMASLFVTMRQPSVHASPALEASREVLGFHSIRKPYLCSSSWPKPGAGEAYMSMACG